MALGWLRSRRSRPAKNPRGGRPPSRGCRPQVEGLEDRGLLSSGGLVPTFAGGPLLTQSFDFYRPSVANGAVVQPDGKVVAVGAVGVAGVGHGFIVTRYNADGSPDKSFGPNHNGQLVTPFAQPAAATAVALEGDGKILVAGYTRDLATVSGDFALARYNKDGSLDTTFGTGGVVTASFGAQIVGDTLDVATSIAIDGAGRIVLGGYTGDRVTAEADGIFANGVFALARYTANGTLDKTFGSGGKVVTDFGGNGASGIEALALDAQGRIVVAGYTVVGQDSAGMPVTNFALARYTTNGTLDKTFGSGGEVATSFGADDGDLANGLVIQPDGKIVAAGQVLNGDTGANAFALVRYTAGGSLDTTFGTGGTVATDFRGNGNSGINAVALDGQGRIVVAGYTHEGSFALSSAPTFAVARYTSTGSLDKTFGSGGEIATGFQGAWVSALGIARGANGQLLVVGGFFDFAGAGGQGDFALVRYSAGGGLDKSFGSGGRVSTAFTAPVNSTFAAAAAQADGKLLVVGGVFGTPDNLGILRLNKAGSRDTSFGTGGQVLAAVSLPDPGDHVQGVAVQPDGKILVVVTYTPTGSQGNAYVSLLRFNANGTVDTGFGKGGQTALVQLPGRQPGGRVGVPVTGVLVQPDGKIVVGPDTDSLDLVRFNKDGSLDTGFGTGHSGTVRTAIPATDFTGLALQPDGKIVVAGSANSLTLARYNTDGSPDKTFGAGGVVVSSRGAVRSAGVVVQPDGKIVVGGGVGTQGNFLVARFNKDGSPDKAFGTGGQTLTAVGGNDLLGSILIDGSGRIVLAGYRAGSAPGTNIIDVVRYTPNGHPDTGFGTGGVVSTSFANHASSGWGAELVLEPSGTLVAAGPSNPTPNTDAIALAGYALGS